MLNLQICDFLECQDIQKGLTLNINLTIKTKHLNAERLLKIGKDSILCLKKFFLYPLREAVIRSVSISKAYLSFQFLGTE